MDGIFLLQKYQLELKTDGIDKLKKDLSSKDKIIDKLQAKKEKIKQELQKIKDFWYGNMEYFHKKITMIKMKVIILYNKTEMYERFDTILKEFYEEYKTTPINFEKI